MTRVFRVSTLCMINDELAPWTRAHKPPTPIPTKFLAYTHMASNQPMRVHYRQNLMIHPQVPQPLYEKGAERYGTQ